MKVLITTALAALLTASGCSPKVLHFSADTLDIRHGDPIHLEWSTRGQAHMSVRQIRVFRPPDSLPALEFRMTATKWGKTSAATPVQVTIWPAESHDEVILTLTAIAGDSLVYTALKDTMFARFRIAALQTRSGAAVTILHASRYCPIAGPGQSTDCLKGLDYFGAWEAHTPMTSQQRQDPHSRPDTLVIVSTITPKN
ncbi:MAG TPA: hypothetical protein VHE34_09500 [Puia sp.]|uniref:hypothetical protein n=1 Tax=Puia sp. TaxID=2045100 RepID=UPI002C725FA9|nr:hypothetical protein [Puia sp.]HVU95449.1 hypothetical protein [Puia sp.]